jgi:hypothetical protein
LTPFGHEGWKVQAGVDSCLLSRMLQDAENITIFAWHLPMTLVGKSH